MKGFFFVLVEDAYRVWFGYVKQAIKYDAAVMVVNDLSATN